MTTVTADDALQPYVGRLGSAPPRIRPQVPHACLTSELAKSWHRKYEKVGKFDISATIPLL
jgi:hypothetical protein